VQELEEKFRAAEKADAEKRQRQKEELQAAKDF